MAREGQFGFRCRRDRPRRRGLIRRQAGTLFQMTTREKVEKLLDRLSEEELAAEYVRLRQTVEGERLPDDLGELEQFSARASRGVLRHMTEDEEEAGLSWEEFRPR
jgi:hypothetical protein